MEQEIWQYYKQLHPNLVQVLGTDVYPSGSGGANLQQFRIDAGNVTFPLLRDCADGSLASDTNLVVPYNQRDNYVVINKVGIIRYHADDAWDYGNRYHVTELRGAIDSLVSSVVGVDAPPTSRLSLRVAPNPAPRGTTVELSNPFAPGTPARITVLDLAGRRVATLLNAGAAGGLTSVRWDGRDESGGVLPPGLYLIRAELGSTWLTRRLVVVH